MRIWHFMMATLVAAFLVASWKEGNLFLFDVMVLLWIWSVYHAIRLLFTPRSNPMIE